MVTCSSTVGSLWPRPGRRNRPGHLPHSSGCRGGCKGPLSGVTGMTQVVVPTGTSRWELAAETIAVKIRWFGILVGYALVNLHHPPAAHAAVLNAILALGAGYALLDTAASLRGRVFLGRRPLLVSCMEALFIGLLCFCHDGLDSPFRYYYLLSLICCAIRHPPRVTYATCALHS